MCTHRRKVCEPTIGCQERAGISFIMYKKSRDDAQQEVNGTTAGFKKRQTTEAKGASTDRYRQISLDDFRELIRSTQKDHDL